MSTLDDKLLGEKLHYYCSSSEDEDDEQGKISDSEQVQQQMQQEPEPEPEPIRVPRMESLERSGYSTNTGPKGVIKDFQRWKQLEAERRAADDMERLSLAKKLTMACQTVSEEEAEKKKAESIDKEFEEMLSGSDPFLEEYVKKRMEEMMQEKKSSKRTFGRILNVKSGGEFLEEIEKENERNICVICHIYSPRIPACLILNKHLAILAVKYKQVKFVTVEVASAGMSQHFEEKGVPAILVYKNGTLIGNFVRVTEAKDFFGRSNTFLCDFEVEDTESFLVDHGFLPDLSCIPIIVQKTVKTGTLNDDSDDE